MRQDEQEALAARIARALAWRALAQSDRDSFLLRGRKLVAELEAEDLESRAIAWLWVVPDGQDLDPADQQEDPT